MLRSFIRKCILLLFSMLIPAGLSAATLVPGGTIFTTGTTVAAQPQLASVNRNDNLISGTVSPSGNPLFVVGTSVQNRVSESLLTGNLIFGPRLRSPFNVTTGNFLIDQVVIDGYGDFALDVDYRTDGLGDRGPTQVSRSGDGDRLTLDFGFPLVISNLSPNPQETSYFMSIETDAKHYSLDGRLTLFGRHLDYPGDTFSISYDGIAVPDLAPVPIPASMAFMLSWLGLGGIMMRRRKLNSQT